MTTSLGDIKQLLQANVEPLARALAPRGKRSGKWWLACNPTRDDENPSLGIGLIGAAPGAWKDFASGDAGDVLTLIKYINGLPDMRVTLDWARAWLGLEGAAAPAVAARVVAAKADADRRVAAEAEAAARRVKAAKAIYLQSRKQAFAASVADTYLLGRGIDVRRLTRLPGCLGWLPDELHYETQTRWPVMVAAFTADVGSVVAVHRTFLARDGSGKAPVEPARKIWPAFKGAAIRLWRGSSGLSVDDAARQGVLDTLVLTEGVEDALSVALSAPAMRVWAAGSLHNLANVVVPACCDEVIVCADNDWGKPQAEAALRHAVEALARQNCRVRVARSPVGKDVNDALRS